MSTAIQASSTQTRPVFEDAASYRIGLVYSEWNEEVVSKLEAAASAYLLKAGVMEKNLKKICVPGSFELPSGAQILLETDAYDAVICLGCVIQGETRHFDFICSAVSNGISQVAINYKKPVIFGVLTTNNQEQALERAGGKYGNKGEDAAEAALKMISIAKELNPSPRSSMGYR